MSKKTKHYPFLRALTAGWKPRAKKAKILLKNLAKEADLAPQHLTKIISGECESPRLKTINAVEMALRAAEERVEVKNV